MTKQTLIELAHKAQSDAGSLPSFNEKVTKYIMCENTSKADPVAAFLGALIAINDSASAAVVDFNFYFNELEKVKNEIDNIKL